MKFNKSYLIAGLLLVLIIGWFLINAGKDSGEASRPAPAIKEQAMPEVVVQRITATEHPKQYRLYGSTEPNREVAVKAETAGLVSRTPIREGQRVKAGTIICRQDVDARQALLDQARANLKARELDRDSTQTLVDKGYKSPVQLESLKAAVDGAKAGVKQAEIELDNVNMRAPFAGIFDEQMAETGDYLAPGQPCGRLIELNPLVVAVQLTETQIADVTQGQNVAVKLATGQDLIGKMRFIEAKANPTTRTFRAEIHVPNADYALKAGVTADVGIVAGKTLAQQIPGKILTLGTDGAVGVRYLDRDDRVVFANVEVIDESPSGVWVTGLPKTARIIIQGQDFVAEGVQVKPSTDAFDSATQ